MKRFELFDEELEFRIHDHETNKIFGTWDLDYLTDLLNEQDEKIKELKQESQQLQQSQNNKAIEVLEKVRDFCISNSDSFWMIDFCELEECIIDKQISELKGKENG